MKQAGETKEVPLASLQPHPENYRHHPDDQVRRIAASLDKHGQYRTVVVQASTNRILAGHGVVAAAREAGEETILATVVDCSDEEALIILVDDNELSRRAEDDPEELTRLLTSLEEQDVYTETWENGRELEDLIAGLTYPKAEVPEDPGAGEPQAEAITQPGDLWLLGKHRVLCGDCTVATDVERLFGKQQARMVWTDPPYGVNYADKNEFLNSLDRGNHIQVPIENDHMSEGETEALAQDALTLAATACVPGGSCYVACPPGTPLPHFIAAVAASGFAFKHSLVWVKQQFVLGRCDYHYRHEVVLYGWKQDAAHFFVDDHTKDSVFEVDKPHTSDSHPTMKPVELIAPMLENSSKHGEIVYDCFLGSGSTLAAAEQTGRTCYGIEIEPRYVDVTIRRWQKMTGERAILEATGEPFPE